MEANSSHADGRISSGGLWPRNIALAVLLSGLLLTAFLAALTEVEQARKPSIAQMWRAYRHQEGCGGLSKNEAEASRLAREVIDGVRKLADAGDDNAMFLLGYAYYEGMGVQANDDACVEWFQRACDADNVKALGYLA
ncbi:MAG: sel1 repeat family protein [Candidatus Coatesbacteria bacterium]|nr:sel1 repeat family protein [Candidatus Coatesbacteria bacterium]